MSITTLIPGANVAMPAGAVTLTLQQHGSSPSADLSAYLLAESTQKVRGDHDMVFYNQTSVAGGKVSMRQQGSETVFQLNLEPVEAAVGKIAFCATLDTPHRFRELQRLSITLSGPTGVFAQADIDTRNLQEAALIVGECYRRNGSWKFRLVVQGFEGGLQPLAEHFGVEIAAPAPAPAPTPAPAPAPAPAAKISLSKVSLSKSNSTIRLEKQGSSFDQIRINLNWNRGAGANSGSKGLFGGLLGSKSSGIDLDLGCMFQMQNGEGSVIQALGNRFGSFDQFPWMQLKGDDRTGQNSDGEWLHINGRHWDKIKRIVIFAFIYEGVPNWAATDGVVKILIPNQPEIEVQLNETSSLGMCAIAEISNQQGSLQVQRLIRYFEGHPELDAAYGFGFRWKAGSK